eukprot:6271844-Prymnesium_polylepis.1
MLLLPWRGWLTLLTVTWSLICAAVVAYGVHRVYCAESTEEESDEAKQQRVRDARDKMLREGANKNKRARCSAV